MEVALAFDVSLPKFGEFMLFFPQCDRPILSQSLRVLRIHLTSCTHIYIYIHIFLGVCWITISVVNRFAQWGGLNSWWDNVEESRVFTIQPKEFPRNCILMFHWFISLVSSWQFSFKPSLLSAVTILDSTPFGQNWVPKCTTPPKNYYNNARLLSPNPDIWHIWPFESIFTSFWPMATFFAMTKATRLLGVSLRGGGDQQRTRLGTLLGTGSHGHASGSHGRHDSAMIYHLLPMFHAFRWFFSSQSAL